VEAPETELWFSFCGEPLLDSGLDLIVFGIDGYSQETYEDVRIGGVRDVLYAKVEELRRHWAVTMMHVFWDGRVPRCAFARGRRRRGQR